MYEEDPIEGWSAQNLCPDGQVPFSVIYSEELQDDES